MNFSCCTWALNDTEEVILAQLTHIGFRFIDVRPDTFTAKASREQIRALGLRVSCVAISFGLPQGVAFGNPDGAVRGQALALASSALAQAANLGASAAYVIPDLDGSPPALARYADTAAALAERAAQHAIKLCIEHFPGRALPTIAATLNFLAGVGHPNLYLLFDIGHAQMSGEEPAAAIGQAGERLGYVHLDDNNGAHDLHWALLDGVLTQETLRRTLTALGDVGYADCVSLELNPTLPDPLDAIRRSWEVVQQIALEIGD
jgi:sugar phosphate isomerase/epimerase